MPEVHLTGAPGAAVAILPAAVAPLRAFFLALPSRPDVEKLPFGWAVPHSSHLVGFAREGSLLRERAFVADGRTFVHLACCCGATPFELAADLGILPEYLGPLAAEQTTMIKLQRRLRANLHDAEARELLRWRGVSMQQALLWRPPDAGSPSDVWGGSCAA